MGKIVCYDCGSENCSFVDGTFKCQSCNITRSWNQVLSDFGYEINLKINGPFEVLVDGLMGKIEFFKNFADTEKPVIRIEYAHPSKLKDLILRIGLHLGVGISIIQTGVDPDCVRCPVCSLEYEENGKGEIQIGCRNPIHLTFKTPNLYYASLIEKKYPKLIRSIGQNHIQIGKITYATKNVPGKHWYSKLVTVTTEHDHVGKIEFRVKPNDPRDLAIAVTRSILESEELKVVYTLLRNNLFHGIRLVVVK